MEVIKVWTDGGCHGNPGVGGYAAVVVSELEGGLEHKISGGEKLTTNNIMEMTAAIRALEFCLKSYGENSQIVVWTDSQYLKNGITEWITGWKKRGWKTSGGNPVKNKELWVALDDLCQKFTEVKWNWVKGHNGNKYNEICDSLCQEEIAKLEN